MKTIQLLAITLVLVSLSSAKSSNEGSMKYKLMGDVENIEVIQTDQSPVKSMKEVFSIQGTGECDTAEENTKKCSQMYLQIKNESGLNVYWIGSDKHHGNIIHQPRTGCKIASGQQASADYGQTLKGPDITIKLVDSGGNRISFRINQNYCSTKGGAVHCPTSTNGGHGVVTCQAAEYGKQSGKAFVLLLPP